MKDHRAQAAADAINDYMHNEAETIGRVTGSTGATVIHEHRDPETGELVTDSVQTWTRDGVQS